MAPLMIASCASASRSAGRKCSNGRRLLLTWMSRGRHAGAEGDEVGVAVAAGGAVDDPAVGAELVGDAAFAVGSAGASWPASVDEPPGLFPGQGWPGGVIEIPVSVLTGCVDRPAKGTGGPVVARRRRCRLAAARSGGARHSGAGREAVSRGPPSPTRGRSGRRRRRTRLRAWTAFLLALRRFWARADARGAGVAWSAMRMPRTMAAAMAMAIDGSTVMRRFSRVWAVLRRSTRNQWYGRSKTAAILCRLVGAGLVRRRGHQSETWWGALPMRRASSPWVRSASSSASLMLWAMIRLELLGRSDTPRNVAVFRPVRTSPSSSDFRRRGIGWRRSLRRNHLLPPLQLARARSPPTARTRPRASADSPSVDARLRSRPTSRLPRAVVVPLYARVRSLRTTDGRVCPMI